MSETRIRRALVVALFVTASMAVAVAAQDFGSNIEELTPIDREGKSIHVSALLFGDVFTIPGHHLEEFDGESGWWTRRIYFTADFLNLGFANAVFRVRLEANQLSDFSSDYKSNLKDLYIQFRPGAHQIWVGHAPTLTFSAVEAHWDYRWFEKTPMDIQGANSRLDGIRAAGPLTPDGPLYYRFAAGQSKDLGFVTDSVRKGQVALTYMPEKRQFFGDVYVDYLDENEDENEDSAWSFQLSGGWNREKNHAGLLYFHRDWDNLGERFRVASFYWVHSMRLWHLGLVGRVDRLLDPSVKGDGIDYIPFDPTAKATAIFAGIDIKLHQNVDLMPNVKYVGYDTNDEGIRPDDDWYLNLTVSVTVP